jgi:hypothetical protein
MSFYFATCDPRMAMDFMTKLYPYKEVTKESISELLGLVEKDILRVQDPDFHKPAQVIAGNKYKPEHKAEVDSAIKQLRENLHN